MVKKLEMLNFLITLKISKLGKFWFHQNVENVKIYQYFVTSKLEWAWIEFSELLQVIQKLGWLETSIFLFKSVLVK